MGQASTVTPLDRPTIDAYLDRIDFAGPVTVDAECLERLQRAHMTTVPFENLAVYRREPVRTDLDWSIPKVVEQRRGGWCFELNGGFASLLAGLGFPVMRLAAAVLLGGPNDVVDHLTIEVGLDEPHLVDVGFGESFIRPLRLNDRNPQDGGIADFQLIDSPKGLTLTRLVDGTPEPQFRFRRVAHALADFTPASDRLRTDPELHWSAKPFATRLLDGGPERVTLLRDRLKFHRTDGSIDEQPVAASEWSSTLAEWFDLT